MDPYIKPLDDGNERILPVLVKIPGHHFCLINCYLPSGNSADAIRDFSHDMDILDVIMAKYVDCYSIILTGDLNADIINRNDRKESLLLRLINKYSMVNHNSSVSHLFTYSHRSITTQKSHLDYFISTAPKVCSDTTIIQKDSEAGCLNTSTHSPICLTVCHSNLAAQAAKVAQGGTTRRIKWNKVDISQYKSALDLEMDQINLDLVSTDHAVLIAAQVMNTAATAAGPTHGGGTQKGPRRVWSQELAEAVHHSKSNFFNWKLANRPPDPDHPLNIKKRQANKHLRSVQRSQAAIDRAKLIDDIMAASEHDQKTFHKLINRQRKHSKSHQAILVGDVLVFDQDGQRTAWADYFESLMADTSGSDPDSLVLAIRVICYETGFPPAATVADTRECLKKLNTNKAPDRQNITAEHLIYASDLMIEEITALMNRLLAQTTKSGFKIPIPKKGKDACLRENYRGISITSILGKLLEHLLLKMDGSVIEGGNSDLQFGFTSGCSPGMASLLLSEAIAFAKDNKQDLFACTLDAQKAFDVVHHPTLKFKLFCRGIPAGSWSVIDNLYQLCTESVRWQGGYSREYTIERGVRQGGVLSTSLYKIYINDLLERLAASELGCSIGPVYIGSPTCADDILLLSNCEYELQAMIDICSEYASSHHYSLHPQKSVITHLVQAKRKQSIPAQFSWKLGDSLMSVEASCSHLGLEWAENSRSPDVEGKIQLARRTAYSLMGSGLYGGGMSPAAGTKVISTYVIPRLLYGLESTILSKSHINALNTYHKNLLRQIQGLPVRTATEAIYLLSGSLPVEADLDLRTLTLLGSIMRLEDSHALKTLALRQLALEDRTSSWFAHARSICLKYNLCLGEEHGSPWRKRTWKEYIYSAVTSFWQAYLLRGAAQKSTLHRLDTSQCSPGKPHPMWTACLYSSAQVAHAIIRARLLTETYPLQYQKIRTNQHDPDPCCPLCGHHLEDINHFLLDCPKADPIRQPILDDIIQVLGAHGLVTPRHNSEWVTLILNGGALGGDLSVNKVANTLCGRLHNNRNSIILS